MRATWLINGNFCLPDSRSQTGSRPRSVRYASRVQCDSLHFVLRGVLGGMLPANFLLENGLPLLPNRRIDRLGNRLITKLAPIVRVSEPDTLWTAILDSQSISYDSRAIGVAIFLKLNKSRGASTSFASGYVGVSADGGRDRSQYARTGGCQTRLPDSNECEH